jgi:hypothetical protein
MPLIMTATRRVTAIMATAILVAMLGGDRLSAQTAKTPVLTDGQKLKIIALQQQIEIYRLRAQVAANELQKAMDAAQVPGYRLTDQLEYVPVEPAKEPSTPAKPPAAKP